MNFGPLCALIMLVGGGAYIDRESELGWLRGAAIGFALFMALAANQLHETF